jgi:Holliday junction resolvasome RuvABC endonuclease subunit
MKKDTFIILSFYPNARGLGYACIEMPQNLKDSGVVTIQPISNKKLLERITKFVEFFTPTIIVVKDYNSSYSRHSKRVAELVESIAKHAGEVKIPVYRYSRQQVRDVFEQFGAKSKYEIAQKIIYWFPQLASRAPKIRKAWTDEDYNMGIFDALALAITHKYLTE